MRVPILAPRLRHDPDPKETTRYRVEANRLIRLHRFDVGLDDPD